MDVDAFARDGWTVIRGAFDPDAAAACRASVWETLATQGVRPDDRTTWDRPVVRIDTPRTEPFRAAAASPALAAAYDELIGAGRWQANPHVGGTIPVRFPSEQFPGDAGWHIEGSWWGGTEYWCDVRSRHRGLLALFLFSDVGPGDAPTKLIPGSHLYAAAALATRGEKGMPGGDVPGLLRPSTFVRTTAEATGTAGDVYLCHPFIVHTATWPHRGTEPRMMAQPAITAPEGFTLDGTDPSPVARAIVAGLADTSQLRPA
ncbi:phytanoyl-CoA dioxygenase family protein [Actinoplanes sp. RD1]|uniref:phytanoyl-CoA dioxygenase family protein n=1 Tax=Actinoplanes sp. RD1 TaxID=3064538 RepID=UPI002740EE25|nr:phytanoyl-CoA dioxygenase family protein [Actinoplanes sp. RD1]